MSNENSQKFRARGILLSAANGGAGAVLRLARKDGEVAKLAIDALELATNPLLDLSLSQAVEIVCARH